MEIVEDLVPLKEYITNIVKTKSVDEKFTKPRNIEDIKCLFVNKFINTIFIPLKNDHQSNSKIKTQGNYLYPKGEDFWAISIDVNKIDYEFVAIWLQANPFWNKNIKGATISEEDIKNIFIKNISLEKQQILKKNILAAQKITSTASWNIVKNLYEPTKLKLDEIIEDIPDLEFEKLITQDESANHEYKSSLRYNTKEKKITDWLVNSSLKTIAAFLNSDGGCLIIGVNDNKETLGIDLDGFKSNDEWIRFLKDKIKSKLGINFLETFIKIETREYNNKNFGIIRCKPLPKKDHCLLDEKLYVRKGPASHELALKDILDWQKNRITSE